MVARFRSTEIKYEEPRTSLPRAKPFLLSQRSLSVSFALSDLSMIYKSFQDIARGEPTAALPSQISGFPQRPQFTSPEQAIFLERHVSSLGLLLVLRRKPLYWTGSRV